MDCGYYRNKQENPRERANFCSVITFFYTFEIFRKGLRNDLEVNDIYEVTPKFRSKQLGNKLERIWNQVFACNKNASLYKLIWTCFGKYYLFLGFVQLIIKTPIIILQPEALRIVVSYFKENSTISKETAQNSGYLLIFLCVISFIYNHNYMQLITEFGIKVRTSFTSLLYRKILRLNLETSEITTGKIVTLITKDVFIFEQVFIFLNDIWIGPIQICITAYFMYTRVGISIFTGLGYFILMIPFQIYLGKKISDIREKAAEKTDKRIQLTQDILSGIKLIKMYTWEKFFQEQIEDARRLELKNLTKIYYLKSLELSIAILNSDISFYLFLMTYVWLENVVRAEDIFYVLGCYSSLKSYFKTTIPLGICTAAELKASLNRIGEVLRADEFPQPKYIKETVVPEIYLNKVAVKVNDLEVLHYVSLKITSGLNVVTGKVGSGKTSLFKTILGEYKISQGLINIQGTISYATQEPWLFTSSIKQNILFGENYDEKRYKEVLKVCALTQEINTFKDGDETLICDMGVNLSSGQRARIGLARACYKNCDIYLLDNCLRSMDVNVSKYVFQACIKTFLKDKIVLFITYSLDYIKQADHTLVIENGKTLTIKGQRESIDKRITYYIDDDNETRIQEHIPKVESKETDTLLPNQSKQGNKDTYYEAKQNGHVNLSAYYKYYKYYGGFFSVFLVLFLFVIFQFGISYSELLLPKWINKENELNEEGSYITNIQERNNIKYKYTFSIVFIVFISVLISFAHFYFSVKLSNKFHNKMAHSIIYSRMSFFDKNFIGNILNRFSKDIAMIDEHIPAILYEIVRVVCFLCGVIIVIAVSNVIFLIPSAIFLIILVILRTLYLPIGRSLRRLDASTRSPMIGYLNATLTGMTTIRSCKTESILMNEFDGRLDFFTSTWYMMQCTTRAFGFILDMLSTAYVSVIVLWFLLHEKETQAAYVGLAITKAFGLTGLLQWGIRQWAELENQMTSVERVLEYVNVEKESESEKVIENWPSKGKITYKDVCLTYNNTKENNVLKNLTFTISPGKKVGIVGRTGAGKSSVISALFRLYDIKGSIVIDGLSIQTLPLKTLRSRIAIIPQDPKLFSGSIRINIDPVGEHTDMELWQAIQTVKLSKIVTTLDHEITSDNHTYSCGQKQLICLARALVSKSKILVLDEATSDVDPDSDALLHKIIKEAFASSTVLTIAHRLNTVINSDLVMVIDDGEIVEFDSPENLLNNQAGMFYAMVQNGSSII